MFEVYKLQSQEKGTAQKLMTGHVTFTKIISTAAISKTDIRHFFATAGFAAPKHTLYIPHHSCMHLELLVRAKQY